MANEHEYSIPKAELAPEKFEEYLEGAETRATIARNVEAAIGADVIREKKGIFRFEDFPSRFTFDGSLKAKDDPRASRPYGRFFTLDRRFSMKGDDYILRGANYLVSIDPTLEVRQKLEILSRDFADAVDVLSFDGSTISEDHYIEQSSVLDYAKNATITLFNALIQEEKIGKFYLNDAEYQRVRAIGIELAQCATQAYYAHLIGREKDYMSAMTVLVEKYEQFQAVAEYIESEYREGIFSSRYFTRPEAGHPLMIAASVSTAAHSVEPMPQTVIGLPSGGTELVFAQQYAYHALRQHHPDLVLVPLSLHSIKDAFGTEQVEKGGFVDFLKSREQYLRVKDILIVEDNSSTGRTIQLLHDMLSELYGAQKVSVSVAEADLIRSDINSEAAHRTHVAADKVYAHSVGILPISRTMRPKVDLKEMAEERRLTQEYRKQFEKAATEPERLMYKAFVRMCEDPTQRELPHLTEENAILEFRLTFLSNFYAIPITYAGRTYPSVEHAYQAQKFTPETLGSVSQECLEEINETLRIRGRLNTFEDATSIFVDQTLSSGNAKVIADILRKYRYVRADWDDDKMLLMTKLLLQKFENPELARRLLETSDKYLMEGNTWNDTLWGVSGGRGRNLLGIMLMEIRKMLQAKQASAA